MSCYIRKTVLFLKIKIKWTIKIITGQLKRNNNDNNDDDYDGAETPGFCIKTRSSAQPLIWK